MELIKVFEEWFDSQDIKDYTNKKYMLAAYEAGEASRQAEIDSLKIELNGANERAAMTLNHKNKMVDKMQAEVDELQNRIDFLERVDSGLKALKILKGDSNE